MSDLLRQGNAWLESMRQTHCSSPVTYQRADMTLPVQATFGRTEYEVEDEYGLRVGAIEQREQLIPKAQIWCRSSPAWLKELNTMTNFATVPSS